MRKIRRSYFAIALGWLSVAAINAGIGRGAAMAAYGQGPPMRTVNPEFVAEEACPIEVVGDRAELELDTSGSSVALRQYIDYKNRSGKTITSARFRLGLVDDGGMVSVWQAPDGQTVQPGGTVSQRWRFDAGPHTKAVKVRVMLVTFSDGSAWKSEKLTHASPSQQQPASAALSANDNSGASGATYSSFSGSSQPASSVRSAAGADGPPPPPVPEDVFPIKE